MNKPNPTPTQRATWTPTDRLICNLDDAYEQGTKDALDSDDPSISTDRAMVAAGGLASAYGAFAANPTARNWSALLESMSYYQAMHRAHAEETDRPETKANPGSNPGLRRRYLS